MLRTVEGALKVLISPLGSRAKTCLPQDQAMEPSSRAARASIHLPFSRASSCTEPSSEMIATRPIIAAGDELLSRLGRDENGGAWMRRYALFRARGGEKHAAVA